MRHLAALALPLVAVLAACPDAQLTPTPSSDNPPATLDVDVCALTARFSRALQGEPAGSPSDVVIAHAEIWEQLISAYDEAKADLERCIAPALEATFESGTELWPDFPPVIATKKFDRRDTGSFTDDPGGVVGGTPSSIILDTVETADGAELHLKVRQ